jgi:hypothetical protein
MVPGPNCRQSVFTTQHAPQSLQIETIAQEQVFVQHEKQKSAGLFVRT